MNRFPFHPILLRPALPLLLLLALSACGGRARYAWNGQRGYGGSGDYGYDLNASRAEARSYRRHAARNYPPPGPPEDPWGPYIHEAGSRFAVPERWIREVMHQESGGRLENADGSLTTSGVGAMGLMQVMPSTYDVLRRHYGLGDDPYEPHDNIMAGTAYIKEMYDQFGSPAFLAAYNAGPQRLASYLAGNSELPGETVNYLASIAPRLGNDVAMTGPLAVYAGGAASGGRYAVLAANDPADRAYAGGGMTGSTYYSGGRSTAAAAYTPPPAVAYQPAPAEAAPVETAAYTPAPSYSAPAYSSRASMPDNAPSAAAPDSVAAAPLPDPRSYTQPSYMQPSYMQPSYTASSYTPPSTMPPPTPQRAYASAYTPAYAPPLRTAAPPLFARAEAAEPMRPALSPAAMLVPLAAPGSQGVWGVQVGAFPDPGTSRNAVQTARSLTATLAGTQPVVMPVAHGGGMLYRARLMGLNAETATAACAGLTRRGMACFTVPPGS